MEQKLSSLVGRLETAVSKLESVSLSGGAAAPVESSAVMKAYEATLGGPLAAYVSASQKIGGDVHEQAKLVANAFDRMKEFIAMASNSKKPSDSELPALLKPISGAIAAVQSFKDAHFKSEFRNHLAALAESIPALGWVTVAPTPGPHVKEMMDAGMFYSNRVLKDYKEKDQKHVDWVKSLNNLWTTLAAYVKDHHTVGVTYNPKGGKAALGGANAGPSVPPPPPAGAPPPPPPAAGPGPDAPSKGPDTGALFAQLNQGSDITKGLKKVSDDMKTHKNPALRTGPAPFKAGAPTAKKAPAPIKSAKPVAAAKPPLLELQGKKWVVEFFNNNHEITIEDVNNKQTVYLYKCTNCTVQVKGKVNAITMDSCKKTSIVFEDAISTLDFINCQSVKGQVLNKVPTISIEKTDGCQVFLSEAAKNTIVISAKSSEMNITVPNDAGEFVEYAVPEQFRTSYSGNGIVTEVNDVAA